jgi:hypothetical protein
MGDPLALPQAGDPRLGRLTTWPPKLLPLDHHHLWCVPFLIEWRVVLTIIVTFVPTIRYAKE